TEGTTRTRPPATRATSDPLEHFPSIDPATRPRAFANANGLFAFPDTHTPSRRQNRTKSLQNRRPLGMMPMDQRPIIGELTRAAREPGARFPDKLLSGAQQQVVASVGSAWAVTPTPPAVAGFPP